MALTITPATQARIDELERNRHHRLLKRAAELQLVAERDTHVAGYAVRSPLHPGYVDLVTKAGCTCREYRIWGSCPHAAYVSLRFGRFPRRPLRVSKRSGKLGKRTVCAIPEYDRPDRAIVWETGPEGMVYFVTADQCPCEVFAAVGTCPHHTKAIEILTCSDRRAA